MTWARSQLSVGARELRERELQRMRERWQRPIKSAPRIYLCKCGNTRSPAAKQCAKCFQKKRREEIAERRALKIVEAARARRAQRKTECAVEAAKTTAIKMLPVPLKRSERVFEIEKVAHEKPLSTAFGLRTAKRHEHTA